MGLFSSIGSLFGMGSGQGEYYKGGALDNKGTKSLAEMLDAARGSAVNTAGTGLVNGKSLADSLKGLTGDEVSALAASPVYGNEVAGQQVMNDPLLRGYYNEGGQRDKALAEADRLSSQGFKLQPEDYEAYGQASGDIARMFGQQEQSLASALANRGLSAAPSGAAGAQFTGLMGNKNEQLARMQMQIANQRMENTRARLADTRAYANQLTQMGLGTQQNMMANNMAGFNARTGLANNLADQTRGDFNAQEAVNQKSMESKLANKEQNLGDALAKGIYSGVQGRVKSFIGGAGTPEAQKKGVAGAEGGNS